MEICIPAKSMGYGVTKKHIHKKQNPYQKKKHKTMGFCACRVSKKSPPCRQSLISWGTLTSRQKYKAVGSSTLLCKVSFAAPVFFGVQSIHRHKCLETPVFPQGIPVGKLHTAKKCGQPFIADVCKSKRVDHTPQRSADSHLWLAFAEQTC